MSGQQQRRGGGFQMGDYNEVAERMVEFFAKYPTGCLRPADLTRPYTIETIGEQTFVVYAAAAYRTPDDPEPGIGTAWEPFPGKTPYTKDSELQNAETSAWGRAIMAIGAANAKKGIASADEVRNRRDADDQQQTTSRPEPLASQAQVGLLQGLLKKLLDPGGAMPKDAYREAALDWIAQQLGGLKLASSKELSRSQVSQLISSVQATLGEAA